ncbi:5'-nucleotidase [Myxozyma melibiosi]|uniref:5'-nucleotidase n=1 Tax=Myxozyma melibiosi TaxID=54550 RepID=A0ABR1F411_9ASCO
MSVPPAGSSPPTPPATTPDLRLIHFNDVYHIAPQFPKSDVPGGAARFVSLVKEYRSGKSFREQPELVTVFSGDAFNPSLESSVTRGTHMVGVLNSGNIGVDVAVYGNHDFDFGVEQLIKLKSDCDFPWMMSNVFHNGKTFAEGEEYVVKDVSGVRIGFVGLVEREWLETIVSLPEGIEYKPCAEIAITLSKLLREQEHCDLVIAVTHMREPNDIDLANSVPEGTLDLILGGHDHIYNHITVNNTPVIRSGSDFRQLSYLQGFKRDDGKWTWTVTRRDLTKEIEEDAETEKLVEGISGELNRRLDNTVGYTDVELDASFQTVRSAESNIANFVADVLRMWYGAEISLLAGGTLRSDTVYPPGPLRMKDIVLTFPFEDPCVVITVSGKEVLDALENGVSKLPALEGRFIQVSGLRYTYCLDTEPRIKSVEINNEPLDLERMYSCATLGYMANGYDGFASLQVPAERQLVDEEQGLLPLQMLRMWFTSLRFIHRMRSKKKGEEEGDGKRAVGEVSGSDAVEPLAKVARSSSDGLPLERHQDGREVEEEDETGSSRPGSREGTPRPGRKEHIGLDILHKRDTAIEQKVLDLWQNKGVHISRGSAIAPKVEGRIVKVDREGVVLVD